MFWKPKPRSTMPPAAHSKASTGRTETKNSLIVNTTALICRFWGFVVLLTPKGGTKSVRQAKSSGNGRRMHLKRYSASSRPRFRRRIRRPFFFPFFRNAESVVRCAQLRLFVCVRTWQIYGLRDCTAKIADEVTSSARAPGAGVQNSGVFCARSASAGVDTRYFSPCLIFRCFWIKPKA